MTEAESARSESRAKILKALAHPSRLYIVEKLAEKPYCVHELTERIGADTSTVSKHLSVLKNAGIIADRKSGTQVFYSLDLPCIVNFFSCAEAVICERAKKRLSGI